MSPLAAFVLPLATLFAFVADGALAGVLHVNQAGGGNATTIQGGLAIAQPGDTVLVAAGIYTEHNLQLSPGVVLVSEAGCDSTIIDAQGLGHGVIGADGATIRGFTIKQAGLYRNAVHCYTTSPAILDNRFADNFGEAILLYLSTSEVGGNEFFSHEPSPSSHILSNHSTPWIHGNVFHADDPNGNISAIDLTDLAPGGTGAARIEDNIIYGRVFLSNISRTDTTRVTGNLCVVLNGYSEVFNIASSAGPLLIENNTLVGGSGVFLQGDSKAALLRNIVVDARYGIQAWGGEVNLGCNNVFNCGISYAGVAKGTGDFSLKPRFCDPIDADYGLESISPCAPERAPIGCGLVGAFPVACSASTIDMTFDLLPDILDIDTWGPWLRGILEPEAGFPAGTIDISSVRVAGSVPADIESATLGDHNENGVTDLIVQFSRGTLDPFLLVGGNLLEVTGSLMGQSFHAVAELRVINPPGKKRQATVIPNPLRLNGTLHFRSSSPGPVQVAIYDAHGRMVRLLMSTRLLPRGEHEVSVDARDDRGGLLTPGVYFYQVEMSEGATTGKVVVLK